MQKVFTIFERQQKGLFHDLSKAKEGFHKCYFIGKKWLLTSFVVCENYLSRQQKMWLFKIKNRLQKRILFIDLFVFSWNKISNVFTFSNKKK